jgi:hypothetical protein
VSIKRKDIMKQTHKVAIAAALIVAVGIVAFAADKPTPKERVLRIESKGQVIAEVHLLAPCKLLCGDSLTLSQTGDATYRAAHGPTLSGTVLFEGGQVLRLDGNVDFAGKLEDLGLPAKRVGLPAK